MSLVYRIIKRIFKKTNLLISQLSTRIIFWGNDVKHHGFYSIGTPFVSVARNSKCTIGHHFRMNNHVSGNPIGPNRKCILFVDRGAELKIGNHVGISQCALVSTCFLEIQDFVKIGGGSCIYTTDFHSLDAEYRKSNKDHDYRKSEPVIIRENAFIGANCMILKGVTIGRNAIVGAGSVVTKSIPDNEIWAGNPARFIRKTTHSVTTTIV